MTVYDWSKKNSPGQKHINPFFPFDRTPTGDRQTDTDRHGHRAIASTRASIVSRA